MGMDKAIQSGKEKRRPYRKVKAASTSHRNHGGCSHCEDNRLHATAKRSMKAPNDFLGTADGRMEAQTEMGFCKKLH
jgi:hypothetical protein